MNISKDLIKNLCLKFKLDFEQIKFVQIRKFLKKKYFIYYSKEEYFFEINKRNEDQNNFFPYFAKETSNKNLEIWLNSIKLTELRNKKIVLDLDSGLEKRQNLKQKYKI